MASVFKRVDRRHIATAVSAISHSDQDLFESGLDFASAGQGNRSQRATKLVDHLFDDQDNADEAVLELLNFLYVDGAAADRLMQGAEFASLKRQVLDPRGIVLSEQGFVIDRSHPTEPAPASRASAQRSGAVVPPAVANPFSNPPRSQPARNATSVFVVHGRDTRPVQAVERFLVYVGLRMMSWSQAREQTGAVQPTTYDIVEAGMRSAAAIVVIFSPDDEARLRSEFRDGGGEDRLVGQPRQNVLLEAGMAFASAPERTIFVRSGVTRPISDISGFNWVKLDGAWDSREDFVKRLQTAGARFDPPTNLAAELAGPFHVE